MLIRTFTIISFLFSSFSMVMASEDSVTESEIIFNPADLKEVFQDVVFDRNPISITEEKILYTIDENGTIEIHYRDENHLETLRKRYYHIKAKEVTYIQDSDVRDDHVLKASCYVCPVYFTYVQANGPLTIHGNIAFEEHLVFPDGSNVDGLENELDGQFLCCSESNLVDVVMANEMEKAEKRKREADTFMANMAKKKKEETGAATKKRKRNKN